MNEIIQHCRYHYENTISDYRAVGFDDSTELGNIWRQNIERFLRGMVSRANISIAEIMSELNSKAFYDFTVTEPLISPSARWYESLLENSYNVVLDNMASNISESGFISDDRCLTIKGRRLSSDFLYRLSQVQYLLNKKVLKSSQTVLEVGAGYGALARTIMLCVPSIRYFIVDIPETLFFAELYLRTEFPEKTFIFVGKDTTIDEISVADVVFIPTGFRDTINEMEIDLAINTNSLGEIPLNVSQGIINWLSDVVQPKKLYSLNRFLNRVSLKLFENRIEASGCNFLWGKKWHAIDWEVNPDFERCPYYVSIVTRNLCLLLTHQSSGANFNETSALQTLADFELQDWYRRPYWDDFVLKPHGETLPLMSKINPDLTVDLTITGLLFKLWNVVRLSKSKGTTDLASRLLIKYLEFLGGTSEPFEDLLFFREQRINFSG